MSTAARERWLRAAKRAFAAAAVLFLVAQAWRSREALDGLAAAARPGLLVASAGCLLALNGVAPWITGRLLAALGAPVRYPLLVRIHVDRLPARYLPGGIWHLAARVADLHAAGLARADLARLAALEAAVPAVGSFLVGGLAAAAAHPGPAVREAGLAAAGSVALGLALYPWLARLPGLRRLCPAPGRRLVEAVAATAAHWAALGAAFALYLGALGLLAPAGGAVAAAGSFGLAWGIGYAAVFAPQGIGVFEVAAGALLDLPIGLGGAVAVAAGFRLLALASDALAWMALRLVVASDRRMSRPPPSQ